MRFIRLYIKNIRSYNEQEIFFPSGSTLLVGEIGSGKSTILLALEYAIFGLQPGQKGSALLRNNSDVGEVVLEMEIEGNLVQVERKLKRTPKGVSNEYSSISINGEKFESAVTEVKSKIIELLGYPPELVKKNNTLYRYTVHSPQEQMKQIVTEDSEIRLNLLRNIFGIEKYRQIKENLSTLIFELKSEQKLHESESRGSEEIILKITELKNSREELSEKIINQTEELSSKILERKKQEEEISDLKRKIETLNKFRTEADKTGVLISAKKQTLNSILREIQESKRILNETKEAFRPEDYQLIKREIDTTRNKLSYLNNQNIELSTNHKHMSLNIDELQGKKDRIFSIDICPTCLQDVPEEYKHNILNETEKKISDSKRTLLNLLDKKQVLSNELLETAKSLEELEGKQIALELKKSRFAQNEQLAERLSKLEKEKLAIEQDIALLDSHVLSLKDNILKNSSFELIFNKKDTELRQAFLAEKKSEIILAELKKESELSIREAAIYENILLKKEKSQKKSREVMETIDWLSNKFSNLIDTIERKILIGLRFEFTRFFRKWFSMLVSDESLVAQVDENFSPIILQGDSEMEYGFLSGGERTAVALAYRLALNQTINSLMSRIKTRGLLILDEPTDGFSETQINKIREVLAELKTEQLLIVSHEQKIEGFVDNIIRVKKEGTLSTIVPDQKT